MKKIELKVNDREISLNRFVNDMIISVIYAMIGSLDKIPEPVEKIEITIQDSG